MFGTAYPMALAAMSLGAFGLARHTEKLIHRAVIGDGKSLRVYRSKLNGREQM